MSVPGSSAMAFLRGEYFWEHERWWERPLAWLICRYSGHTENHVYHGGDCRRCWR